MRDEAGGAAGAAAGMDDSGLALVMPGTAADVVRISNGGCVLLARAVLASARAAGDTDAAPADQDARWRAAARESGLHAWLTAAGVGDSGPGKACPVDRLRQALVTPHPGGHARGLSTEAGLLLDAISVAAAQRRLAEHFTAAVAEARLEALRELAYGAGHEINNPLANIAARAQALLPDEQDAERRRRLSTIVDQAFRARDMIGGLMLFARPPKPQPADVPVDAVIRPVVDAVRSQAAARGVRLEYSPPPAPIHVRVDAAQVGEALRVIAINAFESIDDGGRVLLEASRGEDPGWCRVVISDDGRGMDADTARRAFDPFFSGREAGRGIGLGLPKALRLVESSGGSVSVDSRQGRGTRVTVALPAADTPG
ncbi:MAG: sensor histidine kinase [Planctomycetota bacterium]|nr:MAG: sensor histidine kinase [Planctomycetota bacterium]